MCGIKKCGCNTPNSPIICMSYEENPNCEDRSLTVSNTSDPLGYSGVTMITPEVNQISAYKEHLEFVNSTEPLSGIKNHTVIKLSQKFFDDFATPNYIREIPEPEIIALRLKLNTSLGTW